MGSPETVFIDQAAHKLNGLAGGFAPFQRDAAQFGRIEYAAAFFVRHFRQMRRHVRTFAKHQAVFIGHAVVCVHIGVGVLHFGYVADGHRAWFAGVIVPFAPFRRNKVRLVKGVVLRHGIERHRRRINRALAAFRVILRRHIDEIHFSAAAVVGV